MEDSAESEQEKEKTPKKQVQSEKGGSGGGKKTAIGTGGTGGDCDCPRDLPDYSKISTIVWHPNELLREGICATIEPVAKVIAECSDMEEAISKIQSLKPKLLILDPDQESQNAADICRRIIDLPGSSILIISNMHFVTRYFNQMIRAGVQLFCLYGSGAAVLHDAIGKFERGLPYCDPHIFNLVNQKPVSSTLPNTSLSEREIEVLIRLDMRNQEIAEELNMKSRTVEKHIECILAKLKVPTRTSAALKAVQLGYTLLPKMPDLDPDTAVPIEQEEAEEIARSAIEHRKEHHERKAKKSITDLAQEEARRLDHNFVGTEQLLLALIADNEGIASIVLREFGVNLTWARKEVETIIGRGSGFVAIEIPFTPRAKRVLELAWDEARQIGHNYIGSEHLLLGLIREGEGVAARVMENLGVDLTSVRAIVMKKLAEKGH